MKDLVFIFIIQLIHLLFPLIFEKEVFLKILRFHIFIFILLILLKDLNNGIDLKFQVIKLKSLKQCQMNYLYLNQIHYLLILFLLEIFIILCEKKVNEILYYFLIFFVALIPFLCLIFFDF